MQKTIRLLRAKSFWRSIVTDVGPLSSPVKLKTMIPPLEWTPEGVRFLDQTKLPLEETYVLATSYQQVADVIVTMVVRGAPAIGVSAAMGLALGVKQTKAATIPALSAEVKTICDTL